MIGGARKKLNYSVRMCDICVDPTLSSLVEVQLLASSSLTSTEVASIDTSQYALTSLVFRLTQPFASYNYFSTRPVSVSIDLGGSISPLFPEREAESCFHIYV